MFFIARKFREPKKRKQPKKPERKRVGDILEKMVEDYKKTGRVPEKWDPAAYKKFIEAVGKALEKKKRKR